MLQCLHDNHGNLDENDPEAVVKTLARELVIIENFSAFVKK